RRRAEALAALECLGVPTSRVRFLGYPDQGLTDLLLAGDQEPLVTLAAEIADWNPTLLVTPSALDLHPDHSALAVLLRFALARLEPDRRHVREINYLIHDRQAGQTSHNWFSLLLLPAEQARKRQAILCHVSQLVLSRGRFLAFAQNSERFLSPIELIDRDEHHPVRHVVLEGSTLRLEVTTGTWAGTFDTRTLYVATNDSIGSGIRLSVALPGKSADVNVRDVGLGAVIAQARFCGNRQGGELLLSLSALLSAQRVFVKLERRFGFFDEVGWREVPIS